MKTIPLHRVPDIYSDKELCMDMFIYTYEEDKESAAG